MLYCTYMVLNCKHCDVQILTVMYIYLLYLNVFYWNCIELCYTDLTVLYWCLVQIKSKNTLLRLIVLFNNTVSIVQYSRYLYTTAQEIASTIHYNTISIVHYSGLCTLQYNKVTISKIGSICTILFNTMSSQYNIIQ